MAETASKTVKQRYQEASYLKVSEAFELMLSLIHISEPTRP